MLCAFGQGWQNLPIRDMLDVAEMLMVDEAERQLLAVESKTEDPTGGRTAARKFVDDTLYEQHAAVATRDELAKTWGLMPEHQAGLAAAVGMVGGGQ